MEPMRLRASRANIDMFHALFDASPLAILIADDEGKYVDANPKACEIFQNSRNAILNKRVTDFVDPELIRPTQEQWGDFRRDQKQSGEFPLLRPDGTRRLLRYHAVADFMPGLHLSFLEDITEARAAELKQRETFENLAIEKELRERFVAALTHDLRSPLSAALMGAQLIARQSEDPKITTKLAPRIVNNIHRAERMIQDLLDANRIRAGEKTAVQKKNTDLVKLLQETCEDLTTIHGNRILLESPPTLTVACDPMALGRVIENLIDNALKYGDAHAPVRIQVHADEGQVAVDIQNFGIPIPAQELSKLFNPYYRQEANRSTGIKGWGLGLTLVKGITEAHGGRIEVRSDAENGTVFTIQLPLGETA